MCVSALPSFFFFCALFCALRSYAREGGKEGDFFQSRLVHCLLSVSGIYEVNVVSCCRIHCFILNGLTMTRLLNIQPFLSICHAVGTVATNAIKNVLSFVLPIPNSRKIVYRIFALLRSILCKPNY